jgi:glycosyltransferase involved in cell wall biosynthesis
MHILLSQFYSSQPNSGYDKVAAVLRGQGHTVWVGTPNVKGDIEWRDGERVVANQPVGRRSKLPGGLGRRVNKIAHYMRVRRFIRETRPDVVQLNTFDLFRFLPLAMPRAIHFVFDVRQINEQHGSGLSGRFKAALGNKSRVFFSRLLYDRTTFLHEAGARHVLGSNWSRWATVVPMGVDPHFLTAERAEPLAEAIDRSVRFIYIGRLTRRRRLEVILEAAARVRLQTDRFRLIFMGYDASDGAYGEAIRNLKLDDIACIHPPVPYEQVPGEVLEHDVALAYVPELPADWQYQPTLKILEYRALGMPVIASDFLPNRDLVENGVNGLLASNAAADIATAMRRFIDDPVFLANCLTNAQAMREGLTWEQVANQYLAVYQQLAVG